MGWSRRLRIFGKRCELLIRSRAKLLARAKMRTGPRKIEDAPEKDEIQNLWTGELIPARLRRWLGKRNWCWFVSWRLRCWQSSRERFGFHIRFCSQLAGWCWFV